MLYFDWEILMMKKPEKNILFFIILEENKMKIKTKKKK